jgi:hypothetical protein
LIELVFVACLRTTPELCEERSIAYLPDMSLMTCMMQAQPELAQWSEAHPEHRVARWSCVTSDRREIRA